MKKQLIPYDECVIKLDRITFSSHLKQQSKSYSLSGRSLTSIQLEPGSRVVLHDVIDWTKGPGSKMVVFLLVLHGLLETPLGKLESGYVAGLAGNSDLVAGVEGCILGLISSSFENNLDADIKPICSKTELEWYDKYEARVGVVSLESEGRDYLSPWSGYSIEIPPNEEKVSLHIHNDLKNLIFIQGPINVPAGYLIVDKNQVPTACPVQGGDIVLVQPGIKHNLVAVPDSNQGLKFFVFNDTPSDYQEYEESDYQVMVDLPWSHIKFIERVEQGPVIMEC